MNCRTFRKNHVAFVDDTVSGVELAELRAHLASCGKCTRLDARVRRALLLARNVPSVDPSPDFLRRLRVRLRFASIERESASTFAFSRLAAAALIVATFAYGALEYLSGRAAEPLYHPPVVAIASAPSAPVTTPAFIAPAIVASLSTGLALWPAALVADEAPVQLVNAGFDGR